MMVGSTEMNSSTVNVAVSVN